MLTTHLLHWASEQTAIYSQFWAAHLLLIWRRLECVSAEMFLYIACGHSFWALPSQCLLCVTVTEKFHYTYIAADSDEQIWLPACFPLPWMMAMEGLWNLKQVKIKTMIKSKHHKIERSLWFLRVVYKELEGLWQKVQFAYKFHNSHWKTWICCATGWACTGGCVYRQWTSMCVTLSEGHTHASPLPINTTTSTSSTSGSGRKDTALTSMLYVQRAPHG